MIKTQHHILHVTGKEAKLLQECQQEAARCWNEILHRAGVHYAFTGGKWVSKYDLQKELKGEFRLHSQTVQALVDKFVANRQTAARLRKQGLRKIRYPWRKKKYITVPFKQKSIRLSQKGTLVLTLRRGVYFDTGVVPRVPVHTAEIMWRKGRYVLAYTGEFPESNPITSGTSAGVDIGEIHPVALCTRDGISLIVSGRAIRSIKQFRNKSLALFQKRISRCKKGSRMWRRLLRAKRRMMAKSDMQIRDMLHKATRKAIDFCLENEISELVIGDMTGVEKNTRKKKRLSRKARQKVSQMEHGTITFYLVYKAREKGIRTCLANERDTSRECPVCGRKNHINGRMYRCSCGFSGHRDVKAAFLILRKRYPDLMCPSVFSIHYVQCVSKYRKRLVPVCVDGPGVVQSSSAIAVSLRRALSAA